MKITFDTSAFWGTGMTFGQIYDEVAAVGYEYISPYDAVFPGYWRRPKATKEQVLWHKAAIRDAGLKIAALTTGYQIADPDEFMRSCAVEHWKRMFDIGEMMDVHVFNTELGGDINQPERCEEMLLKSLDELVPIMEQRGIRMDFQAHPFDFYESSNLTADIIRSYETASLGYLYSIPHTFHYDGGKGDVAGMLKYAGGVLKHIIVADTWDYTKKFRYNVNPPTANVRCHAHIGNIGEGDVNWAACFETLREMGFGQAEDTIATFNPLGFPELAIRDGRHVKNTLEQELMGK